MFAIVSFVTTKIFIYSTFNPTKKIIIKLTRKFLLESLEARILSNGNRQNNYARLPRTCGKKDRN